ncbi:MAG: PQQ-binding-like beta-propeller repeat protein, partial [Planctomycetes bacterium]|nr:PQQ-binding-like beta-propeller repeat protein [Planctomycetota bacterium]
VPNGVAMVRLSPGLASPGARAGGVARPASLRQGRAGIDGWAKWIKPRPADIDEWTHFLHDETGNAVARDERVGPPRHVQWAARPQHSRDHDALASMSAMTTSGGRVFYVFDEGATSLIHRPAKWRLIARDAFNGVLLWKRVIPTWLTHLYYFRSGPAQLPRRLVSVGDRVYVTLGLDAPVSVLDAATGRTIRTLEGSEKTEEIIYHHGAVLTVVGDPAIFNDEAPKVYGYWELMTDRKPTVRKSICAYQAETGRLMWRKTGDNLAYLAPLSLSACGGHVYYLDNENLHCLAFGDGREIWKSPFPTPHGLFLRNYAPTVVAGPDVVLCMTWKDLLAFSAKDGRVLWRRKGAIGFASPGDLFVIGKLAWAIPVTSSIWFGNKYRPDGKIATGKPIPLSTFLGNGGKEIWGMDLLTGQVEKSFVKSQVLPGGHHHRCYRNKATVRYLICGRRGLEFVDLVGSNFVNNWWVRGICQYGVMPANGLIYIPPDPCRCFNVIKLNGLYALSAGSSLDEMRPSPQSALLKGPAYAAAKDLAASKKPAAEKKSAAVAKSPAVQKNAATPAGKSPAGESAGSRLAWCGPVYPARADEWPTYRGNITRSGSTKSRVPAEVAPLWRVKVGSTLTAPVVAGGKLLICSRDGQTVHCLDASTGRAVWRFAAGGRVDSPPTVWEGLCVFGCADGRVYCLRLSDGRLVWRRRVGPVDLRVVGDSRLESAWPVHGGTLVLDGVVYVAAGRSSYVDGGIHLAAIDVYTGRELHHATVKAVPVYRGKVRTAGESIGALPDVLVSDGQWINMRQVQFDRDLKIHDRSDLRTLCASTGLLEESWFHRQVWSLGRPGGLNIFAHAAALPAGRPSGPCPSGKLIVFDEDTAYCVNSFYTWLKRDPSMWSPRQEGHFHQKYARYETKNFPIGVLISAIHNGPLRSMTAARRRGALKKAPANKKTNAAGRRAGRGTAVSSRRPWAIKQPIQPRAMVLAGDVIFMAGWRDAVVIRPRTGAPLDPKHPDPRPALLRAVSPADGSTLAEYELDADPVFDGLAAAYGRLFLALKDG